jgi:hypothetical protein
MQITHDKGVDLNQIKMSDDEMLEAFGLLPACLVQYVVEVVLDDLREEAHERNRPQDVEVIEGVLQVYKGEI